jgi:hypothetical protein
MGPAGEEMEATFYVEGPPVKRTLEVLNELENELTFDLDVFVLLQPSTTGLISLAPIYDALRVRGYREEQECVVIEGVPVQFLPAYNALIEEALTQAREVEYEGVPTRVVRVEHLMAICLHTGRDKDRERVRLLREQGEPDPGYLADLLRRHKLEEKWKTWTE